MKVRTDQFKELAAKAAGDDRLHKNLCSSGKRFCELRQGGVDGFTDFEEARTKGRATKERCLGSLDRLLPLLEEQVQAAGGKVHWARDAAEARAIIVGLARARGVASVVKGKSMMSEEVALNDALEEAGIEVWETDLGEYIVQLAEEPPSHLLAPAIHKNRREIGRLFAEKIGVDYTDNPEELTRIARKVLREKFLNADMGITGGNFAVARTGTLALFENEGNIRMSTSLPRVHVALIGIEKVVETFEDFSLLRKLLTISATGQKLSTYCSLITGPRKEGELDGAEEFHLVILDNGRSRILSDPFLRQTLFCLRCGACLNVCPVYTSVGGHSYGWVYSGPIGSLLNTQLLGPGKGGEAPYACTMCGACAEVCPVKIEHPKVMLHLRQMMTEDPAFPVRETPAQRLGMSLYGWLATRPAGFRSASTLARLLQPIVAPGGKPRLMPPTLSRWARKRELPRLQRPFSRRWPHLRNRLEDKGDKP